MCCVLVGRNRDSADQEFLGCFCKVAIEVLPSHGRSISDQAKLREAPGKVEVGTRSLGPSAIHFHSFAPLLVKCGMCWEVML